MKIPPPDDLDDAGIIQAGTCPSRLYASAQVMEKGGNRITPKSFQPLPELSLLVHNDKPGHIYARGSRTTWEEPQKRAFFKPFLRKILSVFVGCRYGPGNGPTSLASSCKLRW